MALDIYMYHKINFVSERVQVAITLHFSYIMFSLLHTTTNEEQYEKVL